MKKLLAIVTVGFALVACNNNSAEKEQEKQAEVSALNSAIDSVNDVNARERAIDSMNRAADATVETEVRETPAKTGGTKPVKTREPKVAKQDKTETNTGTAPTATTAGETSGAGTNTVATNDKTDAPAAPEEKKKKGLNNAAKGAIIGAGAGAVGGAILSKENRGKGAIIGGAVGAGAGAVTGVILDKRKKKKEAADTTSKGTTTKEPATKEVP